MNKTFEVNGTTYTARIIDFNAVCDLEDLGLDVGEIFTKRMKGLRAYIALCGDITPEQAGHEIEAHVKSGNSLDKVLTTLQDSVLESDFFQGINKAEEKETSADQTEETEAEVTVIQEVKEKK